MRSHWSANETAGLWRILPALEIEIDEAFDVVTVQVGWLCWAASVRTFYGEE